MKSNAYLNGQDILNWYKTPSEMEFTDKGFPILEPLKSLSIPRRGLRTLPFNYALSNQDKDYFCALLYTGLFIQQNMEQLSKIY